MKKVYYLQDESGFKYTAQIYTKKKTAEEAAGSLMQFRNDGVLIEVKQTDLVSF